MTDKWQINIFYSATAKRHLTELTNTHKILQFTGDIGTCTNYISGGSQLAQMTLTNCILIVQIAQ